MGYGDKMHRCGKFMKYGLYISNLLIFLGGIGCVITGVMSLRDQSVFEKLVEDTLYRSSSNVLIGVGISSILFVSLGCFGAVKEIKCFLLLHIIVLLILVVVLFIGGVLGFVFHGKESELVKTDMRNSMKHYNHSDSVQETWNTLQSQFECCGIDSYQDWETALHSTILPPSCCKNKNLIPTCQMHLSSEEIWTVGCLQKYKGGGNVVGSVSIVVSILMMFGLAFTYGVFRSIT